MKRKYIFRNLVMLLIAGLFITACDNELAQPPVILPEGGVGTGTWNNPMTAYQASLGSVNDTLSEVWVKGYIVGYINTNIGNTLNAKSAAFSANGAVATNMLIASTAGETDWTKCVPVQLPSGAVRTALSLNTMPDNLGKLVTIKGQTGSKYCGAYGVRSVSAYNFGDMGLDDGSDKPAPPTMKGVIIYEALPDTAKTINWTFEDVKLPSELTYIWSWKGYQEKYYLNASAYKSGNLEAEAYAISPVIDLTTYKSAYFCFDHAAKFQTTIKELCTAVVREEGSKAWTKLLIPVWPGTANWTFVNSGAMDISSFAGKKVQLGFIYKSTLAGADTWEIKNVKVTGVKK